MRRFGFAFTLLFFMGAIDGGGCLSSPKKEEEMILLYSNGQVKETSTSSSVPFQPHPVPFGGYLPRATALSLDGNVVYSIDSKEGSSYLQTWNVEGVKVGSWLLSGHNYELIEPHTFGIVCKGSDGWIETHNQESVYEIGPIKGGYSVNDDGTAVLDVTMDTDVVITEFDVQSREVRQKKRYRLDGAQSGLVRCRWFDDDEQILWNKYFMWPIDNQREMGPRIIAQEKIKWLLARRAANKGVVSIEQDKQYDNNWVSIYDIAQATVRAQINEPCAIGWAELDADGIKVAFIRQREDKEKSIVLWDIESGAKERRSIGKHERLHAAYLPDDVVAWVDNEGNTGRVDFREK